MGSRNKYNGLTDADRLAKVTLWLRYRDEGGAAAAARRVQAGEAVLRKWAREFSIAVPNKPTNSKSNNRL